MAWTGSINLPNRTRLGDVTLSSEGSKLPYVVQSPASLHFLSIVETSRIPLHLAIGSPCQVNTTNSDVEFWFASILLCQDDARPAPGWWETATPDSTLGVLMAVGEEITRTNYPRPPVTEVLFYASHEDQLQTRPPTSPYCSPAPHTGSEMKSQPKLSVHAIALSSDLLYQAREAEPTPPASLVAEDVDVEAVFLPSAFPAAEEVINEPPVRKRPNAADVFDEASERRKRARRKGGQGVSAAAAPKCGTSQMPSLRHRRSESIVQSVPLQTRPLSRSPSVASSRPATAAAAGTKRSALSCVENVTTAPSGHGVEAKNKDLISRMVMAGMRLYGLSQSRHRKSRPTTPAVDINPENTEWERVKEAEYKLIYHQVFKGTCFAFRSGITSRNLQLFTNTVRETADKLLAMFCDDPLSQGIADTCVRDEVTPGGRKAFGSGMKENDARSTFLAVPVLET